MTDKAIQIINTTDFSTLAQMADIATSSGYVKVNKAQAMFIMLKGTELGISPLQALDGINIIQGKPTISPQLMLALINRSSELQDIKIDSQEAECIVTMLRKGRTAHTERFSLDDARKMGLTGKDNYQKQAKTMLKWRAVSACARIVFPDVIQGVYTPEELGADVIEDDTGDVVISKVEASPQAATAQIPATTPEIVVEPQQQAATPQKEAAAASDPKSPAHYTLPSLYNAVLKDVYSNNNFHMKKSIQKLLDDGKLPETLTLDEAIAVVKKRKVDDKKATDENAKVEPPTLDPEPSRLAELNNEELMITRIEPRADSRGWYGIGKFDGMEVRVNIFAPEDPKMLEDAKHDWTGKTGAVAYPVVLKEDRGMLRIASVKPKRGKSPFGKPTDEGQAAFDALSSANALPTP